MSLRFPPHLSHLDHEQIPPSLMWCIADILPIGVQHCDHLQPLVFSQPRYVASPLPFCPPDAWCAALDFTDIVCNVPLVTLFLIDIPRIFRIIFHGKLELRSEGLCLTSVEELWDIGGNTSAGKREEKLEQTYQ